MIKSDYEYSITYSSSLGFEITKGDLFDENYCFMADEIKIAREWESIIKESDKDVCFELYIVDEGSSCRLFVSVIEDGYCINVTEMRQPYPNSLMTAVINTVSNTDFE